MTTHKTLLIAFCIGLFVVGAGTVFAVDYVPLVYLPGVGDGDPNEPLSISEFINTTYQIIVALGAMAGVIKIAIAGVKYSMSDVITDKASAKKDILGVLLGLAILLMPWIILNTIYPNLLNLDFNERMQKVGVEGGSDGVGSRGYVVIDEYTGPQNNTEFVEFRDKCTEQGGVVAKAPNTLETFECRAGDDTDIFADLKEACQEKTGYYWDVRCDECIEKGVQNPGDVCNWDDKPRSIRCDYMVDNCEDCEELGGTLGGGECEFTNGDVRDSLVYCMPADRVEAPRHTEASCLDWCTDRMEDRFDFGGFIQNPKVDSVTYGGYIRMWCWASYKKI